MQGIHNTNTCHPSSAMFITFVYLVKVRLSFPRRDDAANVTHKASTRIVYTIRIEYFAQVYLYILECVFFSRTQLTKIYRSSSGRHCILYIFLSIHR